MLAHHYINAKKVEPVSSYAKGKKLLILATGKSAQSFWGRRNVRNKFTDYDIVIMNRTIYKMEKEIFELKPKYIALCDSIYWGGKKKSYVGDELARETYNKTKAVLDKIDWDCFLLTSIHEKFEIDNARIHILRMNATAWDAIGDMGYKLYQYNFASPHIYNVSQLAIYFGITFGYTEIGLFGMDFDFFKNIVCDEKCRIVDEVEHQYDIKDNKKIELTVNRETEGEINGSVLAKYLRLLADTASTFGKLGIYAERMGCKIVNYAPNSMIDCFTKERIE